MSRPYFSYALLLVLPLVYLAGNPTWLWLWPPNDPNFQPYQFLTYGLAHGTWWHLALNMLVLLSFGPSLEREWGSASFGFCYVLAALVGAVLQLNDLSGPLVGASGSLFALFAAAAVREPGRKLASLMIVPLPAWFVLAAYLIFSICAVAWGWWPGIAHLVHIGGAVTGIVLAYENPRH